MVIGATNKRSMLDDAIISRFGWEMEIPLPGAAERREILEQELRANRIEMELPEDTVSLTQGMSVRTSAVHAEARIPPPAVATTMIGWLSSLPRFDFLQS
jgi:AAA+ superfamily predicted ATPase